MATVYRRYSVNMSSSRRDRDRVRSGREVSLGNTYPNQLSYNDGYHAVQVQSYDATGSAPPHAMMSPASSAQPQPSRLEALRDLPGPTSEADGAPTGHGDNQYRQVMYQDQSQSWLPASDHYPPESSGLLSRHPIYYSLTPGQHNVGAQGWLDEEGLYHPLMAEPESMEAVDTRHERDALHVGTIDSFSSDEAHQGSVE